VGLVHAADVTSGLFAHWPLDGNADDVVGGFDGEEVGGPNWVDGHIGKAASFDGVQSIHIPDFELITNEITFVAWINGWMVEAWAGIVGARIPTACEMIFGDNDTLHYVWNNNAEDTWDWDGGAVIPQDEWAMTALTVDPDKAVTYVYTDADGMDQGSNDIPHVEQIVGALNIAWVDCCGGTRYFKGVIDEVMIYDRALTEDDLTKLATGGLGVEPFDKLSTTWGRIKN